MSNLYDASKQWSSRPSDERYENLASMLAATKRYAAASITSIAQINALRVEVDKENLALVGKSDRPATITHYAFAQLAGLVGAPAGFLRKLAPTLAAQNLNYLLKQRSDNARGAGEDDKVNLLFHSNGNFAARAITTDNYDRVWNYEVIQRLIGDLESQGWRVPPARPAFANQPGTRLATEADILPNQGDFGLGVKVGDPIAPAGLYASDHDMFAFMVDQTEGVSDGEKLLNRGVFVQNSEVGDCGLKLKIFVYDNVCGNHIVWGVSKIQEVNVRHMKSASREHGNTLKNAMMQWSVMGAQGASVGELEAGIKAAKAKVLGATKEDVLDGLFAFARNRKLTMLSRKTLEAGYDLAEKTPRYGDPRTVWAIVNGLTEVSQQLAAGATDDRTDLDVQAGRIMEMAF